MSFSRSIADAGAAWQLRSSDRRILSPPLCASQKMIQTGGGQILSLVEDALRMGEQGTGQFIIRPRRISPRCGTAARNCGIGGAAEPLQTAVRIA